MIRNTSGKEKNAKGNNVKIRKFLKKDAEEASKLIIRTFQKFLACDCSEEGQKQFKILNSPSGLIKRSEEGSFFIAEKKNKILGTAILEKGHFSTLYVDGKFHGLGVASFLLKEVELLAREKGYKKIKLGSSLYAEGFYKKHGYKKSTGVIKAYGIVFQPMVKKLQDNL